jgi:uncharacterized protein with GYD domain
MLAQVVAAIQQRRFAPARADSLTRLNLRWKMAALFLRLRRAKEARMSYYLIQVAYNPEGWQTLVKNPHNRVEAVRPAIKKLGGKIENAWYSFGDYDVTLILQMPDNISAAALSIAFAAGGALRAVKTTPLLTATEALDAMKRAGASGYRAATAG